MKRTALTTLALIVFVSTAVRVGAQYYSAPPPAPNGQIMAAPQLDQLLGPIALYPDPLIAQILPAAMQPGQIAVAYNYLTQGGDPNLIDQQPWDPSVQAVAHYPDVLRMLNSSLPWTAELGQAFLDQPNDVMDSVQRLRAGRKFSIAALAATNWARWMFCALTWMRNVNTPARIATETKCWNMRSICAAHRARMMDFIGQRIQPRTKSVRLAR